MARKTDKIMENQNIPPKPTPEQYGFYEPQGFDDQEGGWLFQDGEEEYYKALSAWNEKYGNGA